MAFTDAQCRCCICTSLCKTGVQIIRYPDGSYSPPSITRRIPGSDRTEVVWLNAHLNAAWGDLSCAWKLVSGSVIEQTWDSVPKGAGYAAALATLGIDPDDLSSLNVREAVGRILETEHEDLPDLWNDILRISGTGSVGGDPLRGPFASWYTAESDPGPLVTSKEGTLVTKSLKGCLGHVVTLDILALGREVAIEGRTDYRNDPFTIDTLIGCDENGDSPLATLRLRLEHGKVLSAPVGPCWSPEPLTSHAMSKHKDYPSFGYGDNRKMVELIGYAELLNEDGDVEQSYLLPQAFPTNYSGASYAGLSLLSGVSWRVSLADGNINVMMVGGSSVHIFDTYTPSTDSRSAARVGVSFARGKGTQVSMQHAPLTRSVRERVFESAPDALGHTTNTIISLAPATTPLNYPGERAPSRLNDRCEWWSKQGRVLPALEGTDFSELVLDLDYDYSPWSYGDVSSLKMWPRGTFNLGATSDSDDDLIDNMFWFAEDMQDEFSGPIIDGGATVSGTIGRVEWSATLQWFTSNIGVDFMNQQGNLTRAGDDWATLTLIGRCDRTISLSPGVTQSLFAYSTNTVGRKFFSGEEVDLQWQWGWTAESYGLPDTTFGFPVKSFVPTKFKAKLV